MPNDLWSSSCASVLHPIYRSSICPGPSSSNPLVLSDSIWLCRIRFKRMSCDGRGALLQRSGNLRVIGSKKLWVDERRVVYNCGRLRLMKSTETVAISASPKRTQKTTVPTSGGHDSSFNLLVRSSRQAGTGQVSPVAIPPTTPSHL